MPVLNPIAIGLIQEPEPHPNKIIRCVAGEDLEKTRIAFRGVSNQMGEIIDKFGLAKTEGLYMQYCPMADAFWISAEDAIRNPYYGSGMLKCGEVVRVF